MDRIQGCLNLLKSCRKGIYMYMSRGTLMTYKILSVRSMNKKGYEAFSHMTPPVSKPTRI